VLVLLLDSVDVFIAALKASAYAEKARCIIRGESVQGRAMLMAPEKAEYVVVGLSVQMVLRGKKVNRESSRDGAYNQQRRLAFRRPSRAHPRGCP
jgi:hypothetical protein